MSEEWLDVVSFPNYRISNQGRVETIKSGKILHPSQNQQGHLKVNLVREGKTFTRNVNHLVAGAFLEEPTREDFVSLIHLDGNKINCGVPNLVWRPRHFAVAYHLQFKTLTFQNSRIPIMDIKTGVEYATIQEAVVKHGLLFRDILISAYERTYVWPTYQEFRPIAI